MVNTSCPLLLNANHNHHTQKGMSTAESVIPKDRCALNVLYVRKRLIYFIFPCVFSYFFVKNLLKMKQPHVYVWGIPMKTYQKHYFFSIIFKLPDGTCIYGLPTVKATAACKRKITSVRHYSVERKYCRCPIRISVA